MVSPGHVLQWPNQESMDQFAREHGPHKEAIKTVRENNWFKEELCLRMQ